MSDATQTKPCDYCGEVHDGESMTGSLSEILGALFGTPDTADDESTESEENEEPWEKREREANEELSVKELRVLASALDMVGHSFELSARDALTSGDIRTFMAACKLLPALVRLTAKLNRLVERNATMVRLPF